jgi:predicted phage terminase large subunit-like protein
MLDLANLPPIDRGALMRELVARGGLREFIRLFWPKVEQTKFINNWHVGAMCELLEDVTSGKTKRLCINVPPGCMKSLTCSVFWPTYLWALDPGKRLICASFDQLLVQRQAQMHINLVGDRDYQAAYPDVKLASKVPALRDFATTRGGFRFSTSVEGKVTGRHGHGAIIDDPMKPQDAILQRKSAFEKVNTWFDGTLQTRAADPANYWIVLIMQRVHTDDLAGRVLSQDGWERLILPMRQTKRTQWARDPRQEPGELLWPSRFPETKVRELEVALKSEASAQLQQDPTPMSGGIVEEQWTRIEWVEVPKKGTFVQSWDFSSRGSKESHSKVSGQLWAVSRDVRYLRELLCPLDDRLAKLPGALDSRLITVPERAEVFLLIDRVTGHWNFPRSQTEFLNAQRRAHWSRARVKILEKKANGQALIDVLKGKVPGIIGVDPKDSKEERLRVHSDRFETGQIAFPPGPIGDEVREQIIKFPRFTWDDDVDTCTQALDRLASKTERYRENLKIIAGRSLKRG